ncbi:hypothetical protein LIA77_02600 [Sarocladium implicatum]|nr:hypothetical protein LIA77_02600 [Sarocladium implicatum]
MKTRQWAGCGEKRRGEGEAPQRQETRGTRTRSSVEKRRCRNRALTVSAATYVQQSGGWGGTTGPEPQVPLHHLHLPQPALATGSATSSSIALLPVLLGAFTAGTTPEATSSWKMPVWLNTQAPLLTAAPHLFSLRLRLIPTAHETANHSQFGLAWRRLMLQTLKHPSWVDTRHTPTRKLARVSQI